MERALTILTGELERQLGESGVNLSHSQLVLIYTIHDDEGLSASGLATELGKDRSAIKRTVDSLEEKGYVERRRKDRRESGIYLTEAGRSLLPMLQKAVETTREKYLAEIDRDQIDSMLLILNRISEKKAGKTPAAGPSSR